MERMNKHKKTNGNFEATKSSHVSISDNFRHLEHDFRLSNQEIIELAYLCMDTIDELTKSHCKLYFEQANCFSSCFHIIRKMLPTVDPQYLANHTKITEFYRDGRELSTDSDRLWWN